MDRRMALTRRDALHQQTKHLALSRLFLLLLLACDWVGDPYHGTSPLSRPFSSQEMTCRSLADGYTVKQLPQRAWLADGPAGAADPAPCCTVVRPPAAPADLTHGASGLLYLLMDLKH
jgi:hypothetical protein